MRLGIDKFYIDNRKDVFLKCSNGTHAQAVLQQRKRLNENIIVGQQSVLGTQDIGPKCFCGFLIVIISIEQGKKGRRKGKARKPSEDDGQIDLF